MMPYIALALGLLLVSAASTYAWWVRFRVWVLRQDLFEIRDALWDRAFAEGFLQEPQYREARAGINAMIRFAPRLSLSTWLYFERNSHPSAESEPRIVAVEEAMIQMGRRIVRYIYLQTFSGFVYALWKAVTHRANCRVPERIESEAPQVRGVANSRELRNFEREYTRSQKREFATA